MRSIPPAQLDLFKTQSQSSRAPQGLQRTRALELLKILLKEAVSASELASTRPGPEVNDEQH